MNVIAPTIATTILALGAYALWGLGVAALASIGAPQEVAIFGPICAIIYCSARW